MNIGVDVRMIRSSGIGTTIQGFLNHLEGSQVSSLTLYGKPDWKNVYNTPYVPVRDPIYSLSQHWRFGRLMNRAPHSLFYIPHFDVPWLYKGPFVVTIHDLIHIKFPRYSSKPFSRWYASCLVNHVVKKAKRIHVVSNNTLKDLTDLFPGAGNKTVVISPGIGESFRPVKGFELDKILSKYNLKKNYILYVGNLRASKNTEGLLEAFREWKAREKSEARLVLVGQSFLSSLQNKKPPQNIKLLGPVEPGDLPALYSGATFFVFPSFYEGFGLPPLEAMACGTPVIASHVASLPEVCGEAAAYINPHSRNSLVQVFSELWNSASKRNELREKGFANARRFTWKIYSEKLWKLFEDSVHESSS